MVKVVLSPEMRQQTAGVAEVEVAARRYPELVLELRRCFPDLSEELIRKQALAIDGMILHNPMLETFDGDSELVFVARIAGG